MECECKQTNYNLPLEMILGISRNFTILETKFMNGGFGMFVTVMRVLRSCSTSLGGRPLPLRKAWLCDMCLEPCNIMDK